MLKLGILSQQRATDKTRERRSVSPRWPIFGLEFRSMQPPCISFQPENGLNVGLPLIHSEFCLWLQRKKYFAVALAWLVGLLMIPPAFAGVGMLQEGENLYVSDISLTGGNHEWDSQRNKRVSICQRRNVDLIQGYEYGYSYFQTVFAKVTLASRHCGAVQNRKSLGVGDVELGVRRRLSDRNTAAWEAALIIPAGYDNNSPARLGQGALGLGIGILFASRQRNIIVSKWGWNLGSRFTYFFSGRGNELRSFATVNYAFSNSNFEQSGDFMSLRANHYLVFSRRGVQNQIFVNQVGGHLINWDQTGFELSYNHSFGNGWATSVRGSKSFFGMNTSDNYIAGWGFSYRWRGK